MKHFFEAITNFNNSMLFEEGKHFEFMLTPNATRTQTNAETIQTDHWYKIKVRKYMTMPATANFDFMKEYNDNNPMPCEIMSGKVVKQNRSMVYMQLHNTRERKTWEGWIVKRAILEFNEIIRS